MSGLYADFARILDGKAPYEETKAFLAASVERMGDPEALAAGARAMRARMIRVKAPEGAIDVCGTGGDGAHTLNISTAVAFVVAGAGVPVAKHGNRAMSSKCGAADVLEALGVKLTGDAPTLERCLREANIAFLFAQNHHPSMRHVAQARKDLGHRTIFNLLGPLSNPASVKRQVVGVFAPNFVQPVAEALGSLDTECAIVVHGAGGLDEFSFAAGETTAIVIGAGRRFYYLHEGDIRRMFGKATEDVSALAGGDAAHNARALIEVLQGHAKDTAYERAVLLNATMALLSTGYGDDDETLAWEAAEESIRKGKALKALESLIAITRGAP